MPIASSIPRIRLSRTVNSSPCWRAGTSSARIASTSRRATSTRTRSPAPWPERVVDRLEVVEVEEEHRDARPAPAPAGERPLDVVAEEDPVREPGQRVVEGVVEELRLEPLAVRRVDEEALRDGPARERLLGHRERLVADPDLRAVAGDHPVLGPERPAGRPVLEVGRDGGLAIVGVDQARPELGVGDELLGSVAEDPLDLRAHVGQPATVRHAGVGHVDVHGGGDVLDEHPVARAGLGQLELRPLERLLGPPGPSGEPPAIAEQASEQQTGSRRSPR